MFLNYLIIAVQSLKKRPAFSAIKILCLTLGLVCGILVIMHVQYIRSYDRHFDNFDNIYRLVADLRTRPVAHSDMTPDPFGPQLALDYPQVEYMARTRPGGGLFGRGQDDAVYNNIFWVEPDFLKIFKLDFISGDPDTALTEPYGVVIDETTAEKYFPGEDPMGKTLTFAQETDLVVTGLVRDLPENTHFDPGIYISAITGRLINGENFLDNGGWGSFVGTRTYLTFPDRQSMQEVAADLPNWVDRHFSEGELSEWKERRQLAVSLEPLEEVYLSARSGLSAGDNRRMVAVVFSASMAALVLVTSCVNFANLFMTQVLQRHKEMGVRKTLGARRGQIVVQLLFESFLLVFLSLLLSLPLVYFLIPPYTAMVGEHFTFATLFESQYLLWMVVFLLVTALVAGLVPALKASGGETVDTLNGDNRRAGFIGRHSRALVSVIQFTCAATIVMLTFAAYLQIDYMMNRDLGFDRGNLIAMNNGYNGSNEDRINVTAMKNEIARHPGVLSIAAASTMPPGTGGQNPWRVPGSEDNVGIPMRHYIVDENYIDTLGFNLLAGRTFDPAFATDFIELRSEDSPDVRGERSVVITRDAVSQFGFDGPEAAVGEILLFGQFPYRVIGVLDDFNFDGGLGDQLTTKILRATHDPFLSGFLIRIDPLQAEDVQAHIDAVWGSHVPDSPNFRYYFDQRYQLMVESWGNPGVRITIFTGLITLFISVCGLYALASYSGQRRTKEIGIRKVLGADSGNIVGLLTIDFIKPVVIACGLSLVTGTIAINLIAGLFASFTETPPWLYLFTIMGVLLIAAVTTVGQSLKSARSDPVASLRYE